MLTSHVDYLRVKVLWDHLQALSVTSSEVSQEISEGITYASAVSLLEGSEGSEDFSMESVGGVTSNDLARYGPRRDKLSRKATDALVESLGSTLKDVTLYYHAAEDLEQEELHSLALSLDDDVQADLTRKESDIQELSSRLGTVLALYQEAAELHSHLETSLDEAMQTLPPLVNANHSASHDLLAVTIETSLLKLSVIRARIRASIYGYTSSSNSRATMSGAIIHLQDKLETQQRALDAQERDVQVRLQDYQQLIELVDGQGGGFAQVVEDLAIVRRETEDCRKDLRRLGWTES